MNAAIAEVGRLLACLFSVVCTVQEDANHAVFPKILQCFAEKQPIWLPINQKQQTQSTQKQFVWRS